MNEKAIEKGDDLHIVTLQRVARKEHSNEMLLIAMNTITWKL